jgi:hypothetical protein
VRCKPRALHVTFITVDVAVVVRRRQEQYGEDVLGNIGGVNVFCTKYSRRVAVGLLKAIAVAFGQHAIADLDGSHRLVRISCGGPVARGVLQPV